MTEVQISAIDEELIDTIIAQDVEFEGEMNLKKPLMVKGKVRGSIVSASELHVDEGAYVDADIEASVVTVKGGVRGNIIATERIDLFSSGIVDGDITAPKITMETGCRLNGACRMTTVPGNVSNLV
ncbi:MAG TPA: polymer-forming cytoskeletal protein [Rectinemataceae bacterium]|nr:polymer-forming cytoskeletal protein [Rectinemataceae bacterium]